MAEILIIAAGQAMLAEGQSRAGVPLVEFACLVISVGMLRGRASANDRSRGTGMGVFMVVEIILTKSDVADWAMVIAVVAGLSMINLVLPGWQKAAPVGAALNSNFHAGPRSHIRG